MSLIQIQLKKAWRLQSTHQRSSVPITAMLTTKSDLSKVHNLSSLQTSSLSIVCSWFLQSWVCHLPLSSSVSTHQWTIPWIQRHDVISDYLDEEPQQAVTDGRFITDTAQVVIMAGYDGQWMTHHNTSHTGLLPSETLKNSQPQK